jgi:hypothetical protein
VRQYHEDDNGDGSKSDDDEDDNIDLDAMAVGRRTKPPRKSLSRSSQPSLRTADSRDGPWAALDAMLVKLWGHRRGWRPGQEWGIRTVLEQRRGLLIAPTGTGKSLCYQSVLQSCTPLVFTLSTSFVQEEYTGHFCKCENVQSLHKE